MIKTVQFLTSRIIKIVAHILKFGCYIFHFFCPSKRFTLPKSAPPLLKRENKSIISNIIWQTNFTDRMTLPLYINYLFNRLMSPTFEYRFMITEDRVEFIKSNYPPEIYESYSKLQIGAAQADFWRILVLNKYGGVYMDIDAHLVWPANLLIKPDYEELYLKRKQGDLTNYFIASKKDNPHLEKMIDLIMHNIRENSIKNVYVLTGPGVFNQVLNSTEVNTAYYRYTCNQGSFTNEYFQYIDKPQGKWTKAQEKIDIIKS